MGTQTKTKVFTHRQPFVRSSKYSEENPISSKKRRKEG